MTIYKIYVNNRNYTSWEIFETTHFQKTDLDIIPNEHKLFSNDVFKIDDANKIQILHSSIRSSTAIPGVLMLADNKTYGRQNKKNGKLLYKCVPDDMRLPSFLIPYEIKRVGFSKIYKNMYVSFNFDEWVGKHPSGKLENVIGPVDVIDNFYEYQLYCKSLNASIQKFNSDAIKALANTSRNKSHEEFIESIKTRFPAIEDRTNQSDWHIFTIDPPKSQDFDDGFSVRNLDNGIQQLSIYISNVTIWLDVLNLWDSFSRRISTIYLPDKKRPMLPTMLSDCLCSLQQNVTRVAFILDFFIQDDNIVNIKYTNAFIKVHKNYCYEEKCLLENTNYKNLLQLTKTLSKKNKYINNIRTSHDLVSYLMILMNYHCANEMIKHKSGIFRSTIIKKEVSVPDYVPEDVSKFIKIWNSATGQYIDCSEIKDLSNTRHDLLDMEAYIHITSPIRRLVDLLNIIKFQQITGIIQLSENVNTFYKKWLADLDYINVTMRSIRKVQCDCTLLDLCCNNAEVLDKKYDGYVFDKIFRNDALFQYIVFLTELKLSSRITLRENFENYDCKQFKLYLFQDEDNFKRKIRLNLVL
jgi:exoribonuclease R